MNYMEQIAQAESDVDLAEAKLEFVIDHVQKQCQHDGLILEADRPYDPPYRVCTRCGYAEEGWHCGYWKLDDRKEIRKVSRDDAGKYIRRLMSQADLSKVRFSQPCKM